MMLTPYSAANGMLVYYVTNSLTCLGWASAYILINWQFIKRKFRFDSGAEMVCNVRDGKQIELSTLFERVMDLLHGPRSSISLPDSSKSQRFVGDCRDLVHGRASDAAHGLGQVRARAANPAPSPALRG